MPKMKVVCKNHCWVTEFENYQKTLNNATITNNAVVDWYQNVCT